MNIRLVSAVLIGVAAAVGIVVATFSLGSSAASAGKDLLEDGRLLAHEAYLALGRMLEPGISPRDETAGVAIARVVSDEIAEPAPVATVDPAPPPEACEKPDRLAPGAAVIGDRLRVRFFERDAIASGSRGGGAEAVFFERLDLAGDYEIDAQGELSVPLLGRAAIEGRTLACVEAILATRYSEVFQAPVAASVAYESRRPVLVSGAVRAPGSYQPTQIMTLQHVLAMAGARSDTPGPDSFDAWIAVESRRQELMRLRANIDLEMLAAESALAGRERLLMEDDERVHLVATVGRDRVRAEEAQVHARVAELERKRAELSLRIATDRKLLGTLDRERTLIDSQVNAWRDRLEGLRDLSQQGLATTARLNDNEAALATLERAAFQLEVERLGAEARLASDERALTAVDEGHAREVAAELRNLSEEAYNLDVQLTSLDQQLAGVPQATGSPGATAEEHYRIVRAIPGGMLRMRADLTTRVLPGDVIEVQTPFLQLSSRD